MSEWTTAPIGALADVVSGGTPSRTNPSYWNGDIPWVTPSDITACKTNYLFDTADTITAKGLAASSSSLLPAGTLLLTSRATIGEVRIAARPVVTNQGFKSLVARGIDGKFLFYQCVMRAQQFRRFAAGSTFLEINRKDTARVEIPFPTSLSTQARIAKVLETIDQAIEKTEALIEKYQQIKAGLMHDLLTRGIGPDGKLRPPREQAPELYQETPIGWIPKEWTIIPLGDLFSVQLGKMLNKSAKTGKDEYPYLANKNVQRERVDLRHLETMTFSESERIKYALNQNDLLVCEGGDVGRTALWNVDEIACFYQKAIHRLRAQDTRIRPQYMLRFMRFAKETGAFNNFTSQTSIAHLTQQKLETLPVPTPTEAEQERDARAVDAIDTRIATEQATRDKLNSQKAGLMHDLLTGKVPVNPDPTEPADA